MSSHVWLQHSFDGVGEGLSSGFGGVLHLDHHIFEGLRLESTFFAVQLQPPVGNSPGAFERQVALAVKAQLEKAIIRFKALAVRQGNLLAGAPVAADARRRKVFGLKQKFHGLRIRLQHQAVAQLGERGIDHYPFFDAK